MLSEAEIRELIDGWRAVNKTVTENPHLFDAYDRGMTAGSVIALEAVLDGLE